MTPVRPVADTASGTTFEELAYELYDVLAGARRGSEPGTTHEIIVRFLKRAASTAESKLDLAIASLAEQDKWTERLQAALKPFADWGTQLDGDYTTSGYPDACPVMLCPDQPNKGAPTVGDLRRARVALNQSMDKGA
jgi:hypothetical protein